MSHFLGKESRKFHLRGGNRKKSLKRIGREPFFHLLKALYTMAINTHIYICPNAVFIYILHASPFFYTA